VRPHWYNPRMLRRAPSRWPLLIVLLGLGLLAGLALALVLALPKVTAVSPAPGESISSRAPIRIGFNRPMDHASVEAALHIAPEAKSVFAWEGNTLIVTHPTWTASTPVTVTLAGGRTRTGLPLLEAHTWAFTVSGARIAYLSGAGATLWVLPLAEKASPKLVVAEPHGIYDFDVDPDGLHFVYAVLRADGGADLRLINLDGTAVTDILKCPDAACLAPTFSPDGTRVAYEWHPLVRGLAGEVTFGDPQIRALTLATGETQQLGEADGQTRFPRWGPDGRLSWFDSIRQALVIRDLASGAVTYVPNTFGESGTWSPDGQFIVYPEIFFPPEPTNVPSGTVEAEGSDKFFSHLLKVEIATNAAQNLSGEGVVEDASPVYSPDGAWLAFGRKGLAENDWTPGRQLWLMRADGSAARALTNEPFYNHSAFVWSAAGQQIVYMRFNAADPAAPAAIWVINTDGSGARQLIENAYLPEWLP